MDNILLTAHDLYFKYEKEYVIKGLNFKIEDKTITAVCGANGAGKTTLVKLMLQLLKPTKGHIKYFFDLTTKCSYIPQVINYNKRFPISVLDLVKTSRLFKNKLFYSKYDLEKSLISLEKVGMLDKINTDFRTLSLGQKQKVLIANALSRESKLIIMDEPFASVDHQTTDEIINNLTTIKQNSAIIMVSHDHKINATLSEIVIEM